MLSTPVSFQMITRDMNATLNRTANQPDVKRATEYYRENITKVSSLDEFFAARPMVPDGDRHHVAQSGRVEDGVDVGPDANDHVIGELVQPDDVEELSRRVEGPEPAHHIAERPQGRRGLPDRVILRHREHLQRSRSTRLVKSSWQ